MNDQSWNATHGVDENAKLEVLFMDELQDMYWSERQLAVVLRKLAENATSEELKNAFVKHSIETRGHVELLEDVFRKLGNSGSGRRCAAMEGLITEAEGIIENTESGSMVRDCGLIMAAQKVEHYEIASYGTLRTISRTLGYDEVADILQEILDEEGEADKKLTELAESFVNERASVE